MDGSFFLVVCLNPVLQKTLVLPEYSEGGVNRLTDHHLDASGKGVNVCRGLNGLNEKAVLLSQAGGWNRDAFLSFCSAKGIDVRPVDSGSEIRFCYTVLSAVRNTTTEIVERARPVSAGTEEGVRAEFAGLLGRAHTLIVTGTKADGFSQELYPDMVRAARDAGKTVILDIHGRDLLDCLKYGPDVIKPNRDEFTATYPREHASQRMLSLWREFGTATVLTDGGKECMFLENGTVKSIKPPALPAEAGLTNTTGCGDAFTAGFAYLYRTNKKMSEAVLCGMGEAVKKALRLKP